MAQTTIPPPPDSWDSARRVARRLFQPIERFLHVEAAGGVVLLVAAVVALGWANSPWGASYEHFWHTPITLGVGPFVSSQTLHFWINDGLMTVFFFVVGLEIRRELHEGELSDRKRAALPIAAALGGMTVPALIYLAFNAGDAELRRGWGVPTATDIAFAVGVLTLLGRRVPPALRVLLLALAIMDDIGAIVIIAVFYSGNFSFGGIALALAGVAAILALQRFGVRRLAVYVVPSAIVWLGTLRAGVHPTIAGVVIGLLTPVRPWFGKEGFLSAAGAAIEEFRRRANGRGGETPDLLPPLRRIKEAHREALPPGTRIQAGLHPWVAYGIMPLFALANAGVSLRGLDVDSSGFVPIGLGVAIGLVVGKPIGILAASFVTVKLKICALPRGVSWLGVLVVGLVAGIGFTMAIFIAGLAFKSAAMVATSKLAILAASAVSAVVGLTVGRMILGRVPVPGAATSAAEAEAALDK